MLKFELDNIFHFYIPKGRRRSKSDGSDSGEENMSKKELALQQALDQITSAFGKGSIMWLGRSVSPKNVPVVSTGSFALDVALGIGGLPKVCLDPCMKRFLVHLFHVNKLLTFFNTSNCLMVTNLSIFPQFVSIGTCCGNIWSRGFCKNNSCFTCDCRGTEARRLSSYNALTMIL